MRAMCTGAVVVSHDNPVPFVHLGHETGVMKAQNNGFYNHVTAYHIFRAGAASCFFNLGRILSKANDEMRNEIGIQCD